MRDLILMRGAPGAGKSTWLEKNGLKPYAICPDDIRLMLSGPVYDWKSGEPSINQANDKQVWKMTFDIVEQRMINGDLTVIDATNANISRWRDLAERYRYRIWVKSFDTSLDECIERNKCRGFKNVPESVIRKIYSDIENAPIPGYATILDDRFFSKESMLEDFDSYRSIYVFGDIHGCYYPLVSFFTEVGINDEDLYIFVGDYLDRGIQNKEVLEFFFTVMNKKNFIFLEGNHSWEKKWAEGQEDLIKSNEFLKYTLPQIELLPKKTIKEFCRRWRQMLYFKKKISGEDYRFFVTHAGFGYFPYAFRAIPTKDYLKGGKYEDDVDSEFDRKAEDHLIQIHGHRNVYEYQMDKFKHSVNLCSSVEFGSPLRVMKISEDGLKFLEYDNLIFSNRANTFHLKTPKSLENVENVHDLIESLRASLKYINEKDLGDGISSFNFNREVFFSSKWSQLNKMARGLFVDVQNEKIVARSYLKFFNLMEGDKNSIEWLRDNLKFPVMAYRKYNGYLGILSFYNGKLQFFSKSTNAGDYALMFKSLFERLVSKEDQEKISKHLESSGTSFVFEVIEPQFDPHIIKYDEPEIILLDEIKNTIGFSKTKYEDLVDLASSFHLTVKALERKVETFDELHAMFDLMEHEGNSYLTGEKIEGLVIEDSNGYMFKLKTGFYKYWKTMRSIKEKLFSEHAISKSMSNDFIEWMKSLPIEELQNSIIELRERFINDTKGDLK